jgi:hypothetical protein
MKTWTKEMDYDPNMRPDKKQMMKGMAVSVIGNFLFVWMLAFYLAGWKYFPNSNEMGTTSFAVNSALSAWLGFFVPVHLSKTFGRKNTTTKYRHAISVALTRIFELRLLKALTSITR